MLYCMVRITPAASRAARALLRWSTRDLAHFSGVSFTTVNKIEQGATGRPATVERIVGAFRAHGVEVDCGPSREGAAFQPAAPAPADTAEVIVASIVRIARLSRKGDRAAGLAGTQLSLLVTVRYNPGITLKALAKAEGVAHSTMSRMVSALAALGWIQRERSGDARFQRLRLTDAGHKAFEAAWARRVAAMMQLAERLQPATAHDLVKTLRPLADEMGMPASGTGREAAEFQGPAVN